MTVMLKGTTTGVATDMDGKFVLEIPQTEQMGYLFVPLWGWKLGK